VELWTLFFYNLVQTMEWMCIGVIGGFIYELKRRLAIILGLTLLVLMVSASFIGLLKGVPLEYNPLKYIGSYIGGILFWPSFSSGQSLARKFRDA